MRNKRASVPEKKYLKKKNNGVYTNICVPGFLCTLFILNTHTPFVGYPARHLYLYYNTYTLRARTVLNTVIIIIIIVVTIKKNLYEKV